MGIIIEHGPGLVIQKVGPDWWPPVWFYKLMCKYVWKQRRLRGKWKLLEATPTIIVCDVVHETETHIIMKPLRLGVTNS